ncbi:alpha/beta fold hydrolase, partial [Patulibacter sp.]|uniref:alpha/beta fold hydrolase n=1 Tax=Patulibacter sp. TaxID=1912859 RepID=UPI00271C4EEB
AAVAALAALSPAARGGWSPTDLVDATPAGTCEEWPGDADYAPVAAPPKVPTLLLSGEDDTRTSPEEARRVAARTPGATFLSVPGAGHSLIGSGRGCVTGAFKAFAAGKPVGRCRRPSAVQEAVPLAPSSPAAFGRTGAQRARGVARAAVLDATRTVLLKSLSQVIDLFSEPEPVRVAGLRSGSATLTAKGELVLDRYGYVPGTAVTTGRLGETRTIRVRVRGTGLRAGTYTVRNPLADPDVLEDLGLDPSITAGLGESVRRVRRGAPGR